MSHDFYMVIHINTTILIAANFIPLSAGETANNNFEITVLVSIFKPNITTNHVISFIN